MTHDRPWTLAVQGAAVLAVAMGIGRFAYTPILPLMEHQAGLTAPAAADLATANYVGYLVGAVAGIVVPALAGSKATSRVSLVVVIVTLALMPLTADPGVWLALRLVAGVASALLFVVATSTMLARLHRSAAHLVGWGFAGVGLGIALSGALVLTVAQVSTWRAAWWSTALLAVALGAVAWTLRPEPAGPRAPAGERRGRPRGRRWFAALFVAYSLEGVGYIIAGTFLVAAIGQNAPAWLGRGTWVLAGLAAAPSPAMWAYLARRYSPATLLLTALVTQAVGVALPGLSDGVAPAVVSAVLFGGTFVGISSLALAIGTHLRIPRSVALLTAGYSAGQIIGPLAVRPLLAGDPGGGYRAALLVAGAILLAGALAATAVRIRFPRHPDALA